MAVTVIERFSVGGVLYAERPSGSNRARRAAGSRKDLAGRPPQKLGARQRRGVDVAVVIARGERLGGGVLGAEVRKRHVLARQGGAPPAGRIGALREEQRRDIAKSRRLEGFLHRQNQVGVKQRRF